VDDGVEIFVAPGWRIDEADAAETRLGRSFAAIDGDVMAALD